MARPKKYTKTTLKKAVERYFASISRTVTATERVDSGKKDKDGHIVWEDRPILNDLGEPITYTDYVLPPTISGLCEFLGISRQTWNAYCDNEQFLDTTTRVQGRRRAYLERELLRRKGSEVRGVMFDLQNNCGYTEQVTVETGERASRAMTVAAMSMDEKEQLLREVGRVFGGGGDDAEGDPDE